ncbi:hypothetical protein GCM10020255_041920 [Rhodococcus baikonurensis]
MIVLLGLAATVVAVGGMKVFGGILGPVFLALVLTIAVQPIQDWSQRRGWPKWVGMLGSLVTVYLILLGLAASLIVSTAQLATILPQYSEEMTNLLNEGRDKLADFGVSTEQIQSTLSSIDLTKVVGVLESGLEGLLGILSDLVFILALLLFMAFDGMSIRSRLHVLSEQRPEISYALSTLPPEPASTWLSRRYSASSLRYSTVARCGSWAFSYPFCGHCCPSSPTTSPTSGSSSV